MYVRPASVGAGSAAARSGTRWRPSGPLTCSKVTRVSLLSPSHCSGAAWKLKAGSSETKRPVESSVSVPPRCCASGPRATHTAFLPTASEAGRPPTWTFVTAFRRGSMRETSPENSFATQTAPAANATAEGPLPVTIVATTFGAFGSILETVPASSFATQTEPAPRARAAGPCPTGTVASVAPEVGSISVTVPGVVASDPDRTCSKGDGRGMDARGTRTALPFPSRCRDGSTTRRPNRRPKGRRCRRRARTDCPRGGSSAVIAPVRGSIRLYRAGGSACHPHRPAADCDVAWAAADGDPVDNSRRGRVDP